MPSPENITDFNEYLTDKRRISSKDVGPSPESDFKPNHFHPERNLGDVFPQLIVESILNPKIRPLMLVAKPSFEGAPCFSSDCRELNLRRKAA